VRTVVEGLSEEDLSDVDRVAQHREDGRVAPGSTGLRAMSGLVEPDRQRASALSAVHVAVEHDRHERSLVRLGRQEPGGGVDVVAERPRPSAPGAASRLSLHAGDHPVHDGGPLELGEDAEHLDHHPSRRRRGVEGLGCGAEGDSSGVEVFQELGEAAHRSGEPVDPVDEQEVEAAGPGLGQGTLQARSLGRRPRGLVSESPGELPAVLALHVGAEAFGLGFEGVGLVVLVGRDPGVGGDSHGRAPWVRDVDRWRTPPTDVLVKPPPRRRGLCRWPVAPPGRKGRRPRAAGRVRRSGRWRVSAGNSGVTGIAPRARRAHQGANRVG